MEASSVLYIKILQILARRYTMNFTLLELVKVAFPTANMSKFTVDFAAQRENQAKMVDTLIMLEHEGYIFLNSYTDESSITIKGLIKINSKVFWN